MLYLPALDDRGLPHPVDAFYSNAGNFRELLTGPLEKAVVEADNPFLAPRHQERAHAERFSAGLEVAARPSPRHWNLRGEGSAKFYVIDESEWAKGGAACFNAPLESPAQHYALTEKHVDAVFEQEGQGYRRVSTRGACTARPSKTATWASGSAGGRWCFGTARSRCGGATPGRRCSKPYLSGCVRAVTASRP